MLSINLPTKPSTMQFSENSCKKKFYIHDTYSNHMQKVRHIKYANLDNVLKIMHSSVLSYNHN